MLEDIGRNNCCCTFRDRISAVAVSKIALQVVLVLRLRFGGMEGETKGRNMKEEGRGGMQEEQKGRRGGDGKCTLSATNRRESNGF